MNVRRVIGMNITVPTTRSYKYDIVLYLDERELPAMITYLSQAACSYTEMRQK